MLTAPPRSSSAKFSKLARKTFRNHFFRSRVARKIFRVIDFIAAIEFGPKIIEIGAILAIFRPFENFGNRPDGNLYAAQGHTIPLLALMVTLRAWPYYCVAVLLVRNVILAAA